VEMKVGGPLVVTGSARGRFEFPVNQVCCLDFRRGKIEYLSNLLDEQLKLGRNKANVEVKVEREPGPDRLVRIRSNFSLDGEELQMRVMEQGKEIVRRFDHGLALPAPTSLLYKLDGRFDRFTALLGVDEMVAGNPRVRVIIEADGAEIFNAEATRSAVRVKGKADQPRVFPIDLPIVKVQALRVKVESVGSLPYGHHVNLVDAMVSKASK
jgi:hypothetical protein